MARLSHRTAPGCTYFVTTKTWENRSLFQVAENVEILVEVLLRYRAKGAYLLHESVVMPNHLHVLLTPGDTTTLEKAIQLIKGGSSYEIHKRREHRMEIWQAGFFESTIRDASDFRSKADYIRQNPVEAKLAEAPEEWPYSSTRSGFAMDEWPSGFASGAKAPQSAIANLSELKLRPPKADPTGKTDPTSKAGSASNAELAGKAGLAGKVEPESRAESTSDASATSKGKAAGR
jgi:putative transposase